MPSCRDAFPHCGHDTGVHPAANESATDCFTSRTRQRVDEAMAKRAGMRAARSLLVRYDQTQIIKIVE